MNDRFSLREFSRLGSFFRKGTLHKNVSGKCGRDGDETGTGAYVIFRSRPRDFPTRTTTD